MAVLPDAATTASLLSHRGASAPQTSTLGAAMSDKQQIECSTHGPAYSTFVCRHLIEGCDKHWYSGETDEDHPWPDSWCGICHEFYEAVAGAWRVSVSHHGMAQLRR
jgi:hypothetical protein